VLSQRPLELGRCAADVTAVLSVDSGGASVTALVVSCEHAFCDGVSFGALCHSLLQCLVDAPSVSDGTAASSVDFTGLSGSSPAWPPSFEHACSPSGLFAPLVAAWRRFQLRRFTVPPRVMVPTAPGVPVRRTFDMARQCTTRVSVCVPRCCGMHCNRLYESCDCSSSFASCSSLLLPPTALVVHQVQFGDISAAALSILRSRCRDHGTTVTGALSACIFRSLAGVIGTSGGDAVPSTLPLSAVMWADTRRMYTPPMPASQLAYHVSLMVYGTDVTVSVVRCLLHPARSPAPLSAHAHTPSAVPHPASRPATPFKCSAFVCLLRDTARHSCVGSCQGVAVEGGRAVSTLHGPVAACGCAADRRHHPRLRVRRRV
jgi:hypothetical protein